MEEFSNKELIAKMKDRDMQAFETLLDRYEASLYRFFYYSHRNHQTAQDQCGETYFRFTRALFEKPDGHVQNLKAYLFGIARNVLNESFRKKNPVYEEMLLQERPSRAPSVFRQVASQDELEWVFGIINQFDEMEKQVLLLRFLENLKYDEIAGIMEMPLNSIKSTIHRGRKKICQIMSQNDPSGQEVINDAS